MKVSNNNVYALVLAAGSASRFGATKQLVDINGLPMVRRATEAAAAACGNRVVLVVGHDWKAVSNAGMLDAGFLVYNDQHADGLGSSIATGIRSLRHVATAVLIVLADQPLVTARHLHALVDAWSGGGDEIVATAFDEAMGPPILFARDCFDELQGLTGDNGGKHLLSDPRFRRRTIALDAAAIDIDTAEDLRQISRSARS